MNEVNNVDLHIINAVVTGTAEIMNHVHGHILLVSDPRVCFESVTRILLV